VTYRFGDFSVNSDTRQLLAGGGEVHVSPKAFALLVTLIEHRARALSKAELEERLWPSTFIGETNLATLVAELRRALDDSPRDPKYLRTIHRFGYRFVGQVADPPARRAPSASGVRMYLRAADQQFPLAEGTTIIGRAADATIRLDMGGVSRHHARIVISNGEARVEDLQSKNGTFVRGQRIDAGHLLQDGDEIRVGSVVVAFLVAPATQPTETL